ncbi:hypothetical protein DSECCO2_550070 [anaerobic digester metagenome]
MQFTDKSSKFRSLPESPVEHAFGIVAFKSRDHIFRLYFSCFYVIDHGRSKRFKACLPVSQVLAPENKGRSFVFPFSHTGL